MDSVEYLHRALLKVQAAQKRAMAYDPESDSLRYIDSESLRSSGAVSKG